MPGPVNTPREPITICWDGSRGRQCKTFQGIKGEYEARRFYAAKLKDGKNPSVQKVK